jgi:hypothetical protein
MIFCGVNIVVRGMNSLLNSQLSDFPGPCVPAHQRLSEHYHHAACHDVGLLCAASATGVRGQCQPSIVPKASRSFLFPCDVCMCACSLWQLETRRELYDSKEREAVTAATLLRVRASGFPPPPPRRSAASTTAPTATSCNDSYPDELNPFGSGGGGAPSARVPPACGIGGSSDHFSQNASSGAGVGIARDAAVQLRCTMARRARSIERTWRLRLFFHAWRASHSQTCILRNMMLQAQVGGGVRPAQPPPSQQQQALPAALKRLLGEGEGWTRCESDAERVDAETEVLGAELRRVERDYGRVCAKAAELQACERASTEALQEIAATAAALHGRSLFALEDAQRCSAARRGGGGGGNREA